MASRPEPVHSSSSVPAYVKVDEESAPLTNPDEYVKIIVSAGAGEKEFVVHKELICMNSAYFNDVFNGFETDDEDEEENGEEETEVQSMTMKDADPKIFSLVFCWLYSKKLEDASPLALAKLWILCAECKIPFLQNQAMDKIRLLLVAETWPVFGTKKIKELVEHVFDENNDDTYPLLMRVLIDHFAFLPTAALEAWMDYLPKLLLINITAVLNRHFNGLPGNMQNWALRKDIHYHVDVPGENKRR